MSRRATELRFPTAPVALCSRARMCIGPDDPNLGSAVTALSFAAKGAIASASVSSFKTNLGRRFAAARMPSIVPATMAL